MPCSYRIAQEGLPLLLPYITRQSVSLSARDFLRLLLERSLQLPRPAGAPAVPASEEAAAAARAEASPPAEEREAPAVRGSPTPDGDAEGDP